MEIFIFLCSFSLMLMDKRLLSQLLDDSAFPLIVLAMAVSQFKLEPLRRPHLRAIVPAIWKQQTKIA